MIRNPLAVTQRSGRIDALHYGSVAVTNPDGNLLFSVNDPHYPTYLRSSIKMIQALPVVLSGAAGRFQFTDAELAICVASHNGAQYHIDAVAGMLARLGLEESALGCGAHEPDDRDERKRILCSGDHPSQLHNNCSGKHTGMLATCLTKGWPVESYLEIEHPLQQWILDLMSEYSGIARANIGAGLDGCSLPAWYMPISGAATALARFMANAAGGKDGAKHILDAVVARPEMINDFGGFDTEIIRALRGRAIAKRGAMAMFVVGMITQQYGPIGIAVKLEDGNMTPMPVIVMKVLESLGVASPEELTELDRFRQIRMTNWRGLDVGEITTDFELSARSQI